MLAGLGVLGGGIVSVYPSTFRGLVLCFPPDKRADDAEDEARPAVEHENEKTHRTSGIELSGNFNRKAARPGRQLPARLHVVGIVLRAVARRAGRSPQAAERHMAMRVAGEGELLPAERQHAALKRASSQECPTRRGGAINWRTQ